MRHWNEMRGDQHDAWVRRGGISKSPTMAE
jgi:hypothetical protein